MQRVSSKCITIGCPNTAQGLLCPGCSAHKAGERSLQAGAAGCSHGHSLTGDFDMIKRLLPAYAGGHPQEGYMLDICKTCLQELPERPYNASRYRTASRH